MALIALRKAEALVACEWHRWRRKSAGTGTDSTVKGAGTGSTLMALKALRKAQALVGRWHWRHRRRGLVGENGTDCIAQGPGGSEGRWHRIGGA
eukprot:1161785-Pelagomonas_calceolata.AAC.14